MRRLSSRVAVMKGNGSILMAAMLILLQQVRAPSNIFSLLPFLLLLWHATRIHINRMLVYKCACIYKLHGNEGKSAPLKMFPLTTLRNDYLALITDSICVCLCVYGMHAYDIDVSQIYAHDDDVSFKAPLVVSCFVAARIYGGHRGHVAAR